MNLYICNIGLNLYTENQTKLELQDTGNAALGPTTAEVQPLSFDIDH